jgi:hypothetical protein
LGRSNLCCLHSPWLLPTASPRNAFRFGNQHYHDVSPEPNRYFGIG